MNSPQKMAQIKGPIFKIDPDTGKYIPLPLKQQWVTNSTKAKSSERKPRGPISIAPLKLTAADFGDEPSQPAKLRKIDSNSVRKELFNLSPRKSQVTRRSIRMRQPISRRSTSAKNKVQQKKFNPCELSPLLDMEEVEEELINKKGCLVGYPFKTPIKPTINFNKNTVNSPFTRKVYMQKKNTPKTTAPIKTPDSPASHDKEFLELEKMCGTDDTEKENNCNQSPISSVCVLLEGTKLKSSIKKLNEANQEETIIHQTCISLETVLEQNRIAAKQFKISHEENLEKIRELLEADKKNYHNYVTALDECNSKISEILNVLKKLNVTNQTDKDKLPLHNRRSMRLFNKSPIQNKDAKLIVPSVNHEDLRKSTLTKNLVTKSQRYQIQSPRLQKALNMYNSMRSEISILTTPKLGQQSFIESPRTTNLSRSLSRVIQNQCHLLQDTPAHK